MHAAGTACLPCRRRWSVVTGSHDGETLALCRRGRGTNMTCAATDTCLHGQACSAQRAPVVSRWRCHVQLTWCV